MKLQLDRLETLSSDLSAKSRTELLDLKEQILKAIKKLENRDEGRISREVKGSNIETPRELHVSLSLLSSAMSRAPKENAILEALRFDTMCHRQESIEDAETGTFEWILQDNPHDTYDKECGNDEQPSSERGRNGPLPSHSASDIECYRGKAEDSDQAERGDLVSEMPVDDRMPRMMDAEAEHDGGNAQDDNDGMQIAGDDTSSIVVEVDSYHSNYSSLEMGQGEAELELRSRTSSCFLTWLRSGTGVFHVSGKAGSGKSTLMKLLVDHKRTEEELSIWAEDRTLVFASFFFWRSSAPLQSSLEGLYRSILFEVLISCPEITPVIFPTQWQELQSGTTPLEKPRLTVSTVKTAFENLMSTSIPPSYRFCFFMDGLDEYEGDTVDHVRLAEGLLRWSGNEDVKICASSRPYNEFLHVFEDSQEHRLHLHELTRRDIYTFSRQMIEQDRNFESIKDGYAEVVDEIVEMAEGVFLWARLVVRSLLAGMLRHDTIEALKKKLQVVPRGIDALYNQLLDDLEPDDREKAIKMLLLTVANPWSLPLTATQYWWIDDLEHPDFPFADGKVPTTWPPVDEIVSKVERQLAGITKGLLMTKTSTYDNYRLPDGQSWSQTEVTFLHRTVRDYVHEVIDNETMTEGMAVFARPDTHLRLMLANFILFGPSYRSLLWTEEIWDVPYKVFLPDMSLRLYDGFADIVNIDNQDAVNFAGRARDMHLESGEGALSPLHLAAYTGQTNYVLREVNKNPGLLTEQGELNLLYSAAIGGVVDLVKVLIECGAHSSQLMNTTYHTLDNNGVPISSAVQSFQVGLVYLAYLMGNTIQVRRREHGSNFWEILELFLRQNKSEANGCFCYFKTELRERLPPEKGRSRGERLSTEERVSLKDLISTLDIPRKEDILVVFDRRHPISIAASARQLASKVFGQVAKHKNKDKDKSSRNDVEEWVGRTRNYHKESGRVFFPDEKELVWLNFGESEIVCNARFRIF